MAKSKKSKPEDETEGGVAVAEAETDPTAIETPEEKPAELIVTEGRALDLWGDVDSTFVQVLKKDMLPAERSVAVRNVIKQAMLMDDKLNLVAGETLYEAIKNSYWKDWDFTDPNTGETRKYASLEEYTETELGMKKRKAQYLSSIYEKFVVELDAPKELLRSIEWSKAKELVPIVDKENFADLLAKTKELSFEQVKDMVKAMKDTKRAISGPSGATSDGGSARSEERPVSMTIRMTPEQSVLVKKALDVAKDVTSSDNQGVQLEAICSEFLASAGTTGSSAESMESALGKIDLILQSIQRAYGVKCEIKDVDEARYAKVAETADAS